MKQEAAVQYVRVLTRNKYYDLIKQHIKGCSPGWLIRIVQSVLHPFTLFHIRRDMKMKIRRAVPSEMEKTFHSMYAEARQRWESGLSEPTGDSIVLPVKDTGRQVSLRPGTCDIILYYDIMIQDMYGFPTLDRVRTIVDCGANIGLASVYLLTKYESAKVIALEPDPVNFPLCEKNLAPFSSRATVVNAALWTRPGRMQLQGDHVGTWASSVVPLEGEKHAGIEALDMFTLFQNYDFERIDILKIDIEGAEHDIFSADDLSWMEKVRCIQLETKEKAVRELFIRRAGRYGYSFSQYREIIIAQKD
jgi:FkbM family methyltransferase